MEEVGETVRYYVSLTPVIGDVITICCRLTEMEVTKTKLAFVILALVGLVIMIGLGLGTSGENDIAVDAGPVNHLSQDRTTNIALVKIDEMQSSVTYLTVAGVVVLLLLLCACNARAGHYVLKGRHSDRRRREHMQTEKERLDRVEGQAEHVQWKVKRLVQKLGAQRTLGENDLKEIENGRPAPQTPIEA